MDVTGTTEHVGSRGRIGKRADGGRAVVGRNAGGASGQKIDSDGKRSAEHRGVVLNLTAETEFMAARQRQRSAELAAGVGDHEIDMIRCHLLGRNYQIAFVLAILVIDNYHEFAFTEIGNRVLYTV